MNTNALVQYRKLPLWNSDTLPDAFRKKHNTKEGTWAKLTILKGELRFFSMNEEGEVLETSLFSAENPPSFIDPQVWHRVEPANDDLECYLEFYCLPEQYFVKKYKLSAPHSEVKDVLQYINSGTALDLGCGRGRNSLFLNQNGFRRITSLDISEASIQKLKDIVVAEDLGNEIDAKVYNAETASISQDYDLIISTVVLQFLDSESIESVIRNMQEHTKKDGFNLVVAPVSTTDVPCPIDFPFTFAEGELKEYYEDWSILKYNEDMGEFHRTDENGNRIKAKFAALIAQKR